MHIRPAKISDAEALLAIYAPYITDTAVTFEYDVPAVEDFCQRIVQVQQHFPWLVAEENGHVMGYAYANTFKARAAYQWSVETSIYVDRNLKHRGIGLLLHEALEAALKSQGILNMNACISYIEHEDEYLTHESVRFHESMGYKRVAHFHLCGRKFNRWYDMIWMEKLIGKHE